MAHSGRMRHRDRDGGRRHGDEDEPPSPDRTFRITHAERQEMARGLRAIDAARMRLEDQHSASNRDIVRTLHDAADDLFDLLNALQEIDDDTP